MLSGAHLRIVDLARSAMPDAFSRAMTYLWEGVLTGATVPDELRIFWDPDDQEDRIHRVLMHRCFMDSHDARDRGCPVQIVRYATGTPPFFEAYVRGELDGAYDDETFPLNGGMFLGVVAHHVADLHTPVHVGHSLTRAQVGYTRAGLHARVEADLDRAAAGIADIRPYQASCMELTHETFESIAQRIHDEYYLTLPELYVPRREAEVRSTRLQGCVRGAARVTADVWATILSRLEPDVLNVLRS